MPRTAFTPQQHGLHFTNAFVNRVYVPGIGLIETLRRCGGMAYAALDYFWSRLPIPAHRTEDFRSLAFPLTATAGRLHLPPAVRQLPHPGAPRFVTWALLPDHPTWVFKGVPRATPEDEPPRLTHHWIGRWRATPGRGDGCTAARARSVGEPEAARAAGAEIRRSAR